MVSNGITHFGRLSPAPAIAALLAFSGTSAHAADGETRKPNIVYVLTDQWRAQATGYAGGMNVKTPNIDALAVRSVNFQNAVSVCPVCMPHRAALVVSISPFAGYPSGKPCRGIRTSRYTYVRSLDAPWLLYDNETDPYQMKNLIGTAAHSDLQKGLEEMLQAKLRETNDEFLKPADYLKMWGLSVDDRGCIPYGPKSPMQTPKRKP